MRQELHGIRILFFCIAGVFLSAPISADDVGMAAPPEEAGERLSDEVVGYLQMGDHEKAWASLQGGRGPGAVRAFAAAVMTHAPLETRRSWIGEVSPVIPWLPRYCALEAEALLEMDQREQSMAAAEWGLRGTLPESPIAEELHALLEDARLGLPVHMARLGVLLPLSGRFKSLGQGMLAALKTALDEAGEIEIIVRDTRGEASRARVLAEELIGAHGVGAVLGPIGRQESASVAEVLAKTGVPHVLLSRHGGSETPGDCRILVRLSRAAEVQALVQVAVERRGATRFGIFREDSLHGAAMSDAFRSAVEDHGGMVVADILLPKRGESTGIAEMTGLEVLKGSAGSPGVDALFLPVSARMAHRVLPHLRARGIRFARGSEAGVLLLGSSRWDSPDVVDKAEATTLGGLYPTGFSPRPGEGVSSHFQRVFKGLHGEGPSALDAEVYDATRLVLAALAVAQREKTGRRGACAWMRKGESFEGATGLLRVLPAGRVSRLVVVREVHESGTRAIADVRVAGDKAVVEVVHDEP